MTDVPPHPFRSGDAASYGLTRAGVEQLLRAGVLRRPFRGVLVRADLPDTIELRATCAQVVLPPHVVLSDRSAAWLHGIDAYDPAALELVPDLEVVSVDGNDRTRRDGVLGGKRDLRPDEICEVCGTLTTTALRTACDLAAQRGRSAALAVLDAFMRHHRLTREDYRRMLPRFRGRRGVKQLRELINHASPDAESPGESWTRMAILDAGIPCPTPNVWVDVAGYGRVRLDLAWAALKIAVEYDGQEFHTSERQRQHDETRRTALRRDGWVVIVVTKDDFTGDRLALWLATLREALRDRRPPARRRYSRGAWDGPRRRRTATSRMH